MELTNEKLLELFIIFGKENDLHVGTLEDFLRDFNERKWEEEMGEDL